MFNLFDILKTKKCVFLFSILFSTCLQGQVTTSKGIAVSKLMNGDIYSINVKSKSYKIDSARYTVFIPKGIKTIRGVFIHQHGCTMEGRGMAAAHDIQYQAFAQKWQMAIVGSDLYAKNNCHDWRHPESGSGTALLSALKEIGIIAKQPTLNNAPWLLWGHSGGGYWALSMLSAYPKRVMAVFGYSPAFEPNIYSGTSLKVPVMMRHAGPGGDACCWETSIKEFHNLRSAGGYASIAYTPYQSHNYSYVRYMAIPFFEAVMRQRLPQNSVEGYQAMKDMDTRKAWLGDTATLNLYPANTYPREKLSASWFPDSLTALKWREYVITGTVTDRTPPPPPHEARLVRRHNMTVELTWAALADVESGISHFNIYKDGQLVDRFPKSGTYQAFDTNGDDAYPVYLPALGTEVSLPSNDPAKIFISTVNAFGLESEKTEFIR